MTRLRYFSWIHLHTWSFFLPAVLSYHQHYLPRILHCINRTLHRAADSVRDDINRNTADLLPGGQCPHLPPVRKAWHKQATSCAHLLFLPTLSSLGFSLSRKIDGWYQWGMPLFGIISVAIISLPLHGTAGLRRTTIGLGSPHDAMACRCICLLECVPDSHSQGEVLPEVRHMEPCDRSLLHLLRGALHIHCRRK
jgi:hypothetical protein